MNAVRKFLSRCCRWRCAYEQPYRIEPFLNARGNWQWRLASLNGETLAHSEEYSSKEAMLNTVRNLSRWSGLQVAPGYRDDCRKG